MDDRILILHLFGYEVATAQRREITLLCYASFRGLGNKEITSVVQIGPLVEVALE
jgi:hypothetical protein